ncbi:uncharacterized protein LOC126981312 [Eriocheir sinensis]|uniref:uncharacterized protein LOC126981312 n=1 Tax=Eriocheir sinensis TaxID=95602 RepID=UPI0021C61621|nr:uncharacterized protein LOC126981312 [Eriocheir sinensis]
MRVLGLSPCCPLLWLLTLLPFTQASSLQVRLADAGVELSPQEEAALLSRHPEDARNLTHVGADSPTEEAVGPGELQGGKGVGGHHITTRAAMKTRYTIELAVFLDDSLVSYVRKRYPSANARKKTKEIVMTLLAVANQVLSDPSLKDAALSLRVVRLKFLGRSAVSNGGGEAGLYLNNFCAWQTPKSTKRGARRWDHSLLLTGLDLYSEQPYANKTMGMAFVGGMCTADHSCSLIEATKFTCAYTIAHELGHSLNVVHDGDPPAEACSATGHLMAESLNDGGHTWSSCSREQLKAFLDTHGTCLTEMSSGGGGGGNIDANNAFLHADLPGRTYGADQQCHYMYGEGWMYAADQYPDVCAEIWCVNGLRLRSPGVSALDGTSCGSNRMCLKGRCKSFRTALKIASRKEQPKGRKENMMKKLKKIVKKLTKSRSGEGDEKEEVKNGSETELTKQTSEENEDTIGTAGREKGMEDKEVEKAENKQGVNEYMDLLRALLEEMQKSVQETEGKTNWKKSSERENKMDPLWWMGGKGKREKEIKTKTQKQPMEGDEDRRNNLSRDARENDDKRDKKERRKQVKGSKKDLKRPRRVLGRSGWRNPLPNVSKFESPTHLIIKERMNYVKGKGWKMHILKIQKTKKLSNRRVNVKKYTVKCDENRSNCRIAKRQTKNKVRMLGPKAKSRKGKKIQNRRINIKNSNRKPAKKTKTLDALQEDRHTPTIIRSEGTLAEDPCRPRRIKYTTGKGWLVKVSSDCLRPSNATTEPVIE